MAPQKRLIPVRCRVSRAESRTPMTQIYGHRHAELSLCNDVATDTDRELSIYRDVSQIHRVISLQIWSQAYKELSPYRDVATRTDTVIYIQRCGHRHTELSPYRDVSQALTQSYLYTEMWSQTQSYLHTEMWSQAMTQSYLYTEMWSQTQSYLQRCGHRH